MPDLTALHGATIIHAREDEKGRIVLTLLGGPGGKVEFSGYRDDGVAVEVWLTTPDGQNHWL